MAELTKSSATGTIAKIADLPDEFLKASEGQDVDHYFYASVEVKDLDGDVVRVGGIKARETVPFIVGHKKSPNDDGTLPVIGKAFAWKKTTHKSLNVPALVAGVKFAPTRLGQEFKKQYDEGFLTDVSIGFLAPNSKSLRGGRYDVEECEVYELSACIKGANQYATIMKAMDGDGATAVTIKLDDADLKELAKSFADQFSSLSTHLTKRLDDLESAIVAAPHASEQDGNNDSDTDTAIDYAPLESALKAVLSQLHK
jgi:hypothetical protein